MSGRLSILLANYNDGAYIGEALTSTMTMDYKPYEVVVVDDGSTDNSVEIIQNLAKRHPQIKLLQNEQNRGAAYSYQRALYAATGEYAMGMSADDPINNPQFIEKSLAVFDRFPQAGLVCSDPIIFHEKESLHQIRHYHWSTEPCYFSPEDLAEKMLGWYIAGHTCIFNREALIAAGGFRPDMKWHTDFFAIHVIAARYGVCYLPEAMALYTTRRGSYSQKGVRNWEQQSQLLDHMLDLLKSPEYRDVLPFFIRSGLMLHFGEDLVRVVMKNSKHWDTETMLLIQQPLWLWNNKLANANSERHTRWNKTMADEAQSIQSLLNQAHQDQSQGRVQPAREKLRQVIQKYPKHVAGYASLGQLELSAGAFAAAGQAFSTAVRLQPGNAELHNKLGSCLLKTGDLDGAERSFQDAVNVDPGNVNAKYGQAWVEHGRGRPDRARRQLQELVQLAPGNAELWGSLGWMAHQDGDPLAAMEALRQALALDPSRQDYRQALAGLEGARMATAKAPGRSAAARM